MHRLTQLKIRHMQESNYEYAFENISSAASWVLSLLTDHRLLLLEAEMGAGKTTLVQALLQTLGTRDEVSSPTYAIVQEYSTDHPKHPIVYHLDLYRIRDEAELEALPITDYLDSGHLCIIEWPELVLPFLDAPYLKLGIEVLTDTSRKILIL